MDSSRARNMAVTRDHVQIMLDKIEELDEYDDRQDHLLVRIDSRYQFARLNNLLESCKSYTDDSRIETELSNYLQRRWALIYGGFYDDIYPKKGSPAIYFNNHKSLINRACVIVAMEMSRVTGKRWCEYLMPGIKLPEGDLPVSIFNDYVIDHEDSLVHVLDCLKESAPKGTGALYYSYPGSSAPKLLDQSTARLVLNHSEQSFLLYKRMTKIDQTGTFEDAIKDFEDSKKQNTYHVNLMYGEDGIKRLSKALLADIQNRHELVELLTTTLPRSEWVTLLKMLSDQELFRIMLKVDIDALKKETQDSYELRQQINDRACANLESLLKDLRFSHDDTSNRAFFVCCIDCYRRIRDSGEEYNSVAGAHVGSKVTSIFGLFASYVPSALSYIPEAMKSHSRTAKLNGCQFLYDYLTGSEPLKRLPSALEKAVNDGIINNEIKDAIETKTLGTIYRAILNLIGIQQGQVNAPRF